VYEQPAIEIDRGRLSLAVPSAPPSTSETPFVIVIGDGPGLERSNGAAAILRHDRAFAEARSSS